MVSTVLMSEKNKVFLLSTSAVAAAATRADAAVRRREFFFLFSHRILRLVTVRSCLMVLVRDEESSLSGQLRRISPAIASRSINDRGVDQSMTNIKTMVN